MPCHECYVMYEIMYENSASIITKFNMLGKNGGLSCIIYYAMIKNGGLSCIIYYAMIKSLGTSCMTALTCIRILPHYDKYERIYYKTDSDTYVRHDDTTTAIPFRCSAIACQRVLA